MGALGLLWLTIHDHVPWLLLWRSQTGTVPSAPPPQKNQSNSSAPLRSGYKKRAYVTRFHSGTSKPQLWGHENIATEDQGSQQPAQKRAGKRLLGIGPIGLCRPKSGPKKPPRMSLCADEPRFMSNHDSGRRRSAPDSKTLLTNENRGLRGPIP